MKKFIVLFAMLGLLASCSLDDNNSDSYSYHVLPVASYIVPANFKLGQTYEITLKYQKPTACYVFEGIYFSKNLNTRTIAVQASVNDDQICTQEVPALSETKFNFNVTSTGSYIFKFYKGTDTDGKDIFEDVEIPVVD